jgi:fucose permease
LIAAGETEVWAAQLLSIFFLGFLAARVALIFTAHLLPSFTLATIAILGTAAASLGAALFAPGPFFVVMGFCTGAFFPCIYVSASRKMGDDPRVPATVIAAGLIGGILMPLALSPMMSSMGAHGFFWLFAGIAGLMSVLAIAFHRSLSA